MKIISSFTGPYRWLSNFYTFYQDFSAEHLYQATKTLDPREAVKILKAFSAGEAKRLGKKIEVRPDWDDIKIEVMLEILRNKFSIYPLRSWLINTGDAYLIEGNFWHDVFWGVDIKTCQGDNVLGILLMLIREEIKNG